MKKLLPIFCLLFLIPSFLPSQILNNRPRNPIMVINCEDADGRKRQLIQARDNGDCPEGYCEINGLCYFMIDDCDNPIEFPDGLPDGWTMMVTDEVNGSDEICILVPDCTGAEGCDEDCVELYWDFEEYACFCEIPDVIFDVCGCPDVLVDSEYDAEDGCLDFVTTPCYDGDLDIRIPPLSCQGLQPGDRILYSILIIGVTAEIGDALTIEALINCDLAGGQDFVLALLAAGIGDGGWIFEDGADEGFPGEAVIKVEFFRDPFEPSIIELTGHEPIIIPACQQPVPSMGTWGLIILGLGFLIFGSVMFRRRLSSKTTYSSK